MIETVPVLKDEERQRPIPSAWRGTLVSIVKSLSEGDLELARGVDGVSSISAETARTIAINIEDYGAQLTDLSEESWQSSVCQWMRGYWDVLVDLFTVEEGASDLVLAVRVHEDATGYVFAVQSVHVP